MRRGVAVPGPTQWSLLSEQAVMFTDPAKLRSALTDKETGSCAGNANPEWKPFEKVLDKLLSEDDAPAVLDRAARRMRAKATERATPPTGGEQ
jgi:hypothetical protein